MHGTAGTYAERRIHNPLRERTPLELEDDVRKFHRRVELEDVVDVELLVKGALIARDEANVESCSLSNPQKLAIKSEKSLGLFQQTKELKTTILTTACAAIIQGWQQSSINASSRGWQCELLHHASDGRIDETTHGRYMASLVDAAPWISASVIGTWLSDPLQESEYGRRPALFISAVICAACVIGTAHCHSFETMLVCRLLLGVGVGAKASIAPVFAAEAAADHLRGRLLMMWQLFDTFGIFVGFACFWIFERSWRGILGSAAIPALIMLFLVFLSPESPRFLIRQRKYAEAFVCLRQLRGTDIQAAKDLYYIHSQLQIETKLVKGEQPVEWWAKELYQEEVASLSFLQRVRALFMVKRNRRACVAAFLVMAAQQLCGINVLSFYSSDLFKVAAGPTDGETDYTDCTAPKVGDSVAWLNFGFGLANFLFTIPAYKFIDFRGRRVLLLISLGGMFFTLLATSGFFRITSDAARKGLVATFAIVIFTFFYGIGAGPVPFTFSAEVFPLAFREVGMSFSVMVNFLGLSLLILFVPRLTIAFSPDKDQDRAGESNLLFFFTCVPSDTAQISLEEMNHIFNTKTSEHAFNHLPVCVKKRCPRPRHEEQEHRDGEEGEMQTWETASNAV
ncbi:hypothetical protein BJX61DRAFT_548546 [Aspergillus egyptiacus]|nr:hypothetical protein BJX61DRAFT_548546 [Aspergillus egyptiacus]